MLIGSFPAVMLAELPAVTLAVMLLAEILISSLISILPNPDVLIGCGTML